MRSQETDYLAEHHYLAEYPSPLKKCTRFLGWGPTGLVALQSHRLQPQGAARSSEAQTPQAMEGLCWLTGTPCCAPGREMDVMTKHSPSSALLSQSLQEILGDEHKQNQRVNTQEHSHPPGHPCLLLQREETCPSTPLPVPS